MENNHLPESIAIDPGRWLTAMTEEAERCREILAAASRLLLERHPPYRLAALPPSAVVGCPGVPGAYSHIACEKLFPRGELRFYRRFDEVVQAVLDGGVEFGVIPVENSSAGPVNETLELVGGKGVYICADTQLKVEHCLCMHPDADPAAVRVALSHPQALGQCARFLDRQGLATETYSNTAAAAKAVGEGLRPDAACICSARSAELYRLRIVRRNIQDFDENHTRFLCVAGRNALLPGADTISLALSLSHRPGALHRLLTRFAIFELDLCRLRSLPVASRDFRVRFHLDFRGSIEDDRVVSLLSALAAEMEDFSYLGNFLTVP